MSAIATRIAQNLSVKPSQVEAAINLLEEGNTVPFIARYRKEATSGLTDTHLRCLEKSYRYQKELGERKTSIISALQTANQLTDALSARIKAVETKTELEDLYLPYRAKRKSKAETARRAGLADLAKALLQEETPKRFALLACPYLNPSLGFDSTTKAIEGARHILVEEYSVDAELTAKLRQYLQKNILIHSKVRSEKKDKDKKYNDYYDFQEPLKRTPSHRALALFRGRREGILSVGLNLRDEDNNPEGMALEHFALTDASPFVQEILKDAVKRLTKKLEIELLSSLKERAEDSAIEVFAKNLHDLLLMPPAGPFTIIGLDPGIRTGVKVTVIDNTGKLLDFTTLFPFPPQNDHHNAIYDLAKLATKYNADLIAIGNGTGSRETSKLVDEMLKTYPDLKTKRVLVSEAGASVYSATELAELELPELDVSLRGAVSIARRLQDPLAELVKIEPKAIGVGQYQHDVNQVKLGLELDTVVEDCVNHVGVNLNTASNELLTFVAGLTRKTASNIVEHRNEHGSFKSRDELLSVPNLGEKSFQQAAGFLRIREGANALDNTAIHPEAYPLVETMAKSLEVSSADLINNQALLAKLKACDFVDETFGEPTIQDVINELKAPGREVRGSFKTATFKEGVESIDDLELEMIIEGVISNVASFGAFVDIGVHIDALIHRTQFSRQAPPVKVGQVVTVRIIEVDKERKRIGLSMHLEKRAPRPKVANHRKDRSEQRSNKPNRPSTPPQKKGQAPRKHTKPRAKVEKSATVFNTAMADALQKLKK